MPRFPDLVAAPVVPGGAAYSALADRIAAVRGETYPLHLGDTWRAPPVGARMEDLRCDEVPGLHNYAPFDGHPPLVAAIGARRSARDGVATGPGELLITAGATAGFGAMLSATVNPGEEVLCLAPHWPLIVGLIRQAHAEPVAVPFHGAVGSAEEAVAALAARVTARSAALYLGTPNNPTGEVIPRAWLASIVAWAEAEGLWIFADEVYEDFVYRGEHVRCRALAPTRTLAAHSFSKAYGMAGNRCGYVVGPPAAIALARRAAAHTFYGTPMASQVAATRVLGPEGDAWIAEAKESYAAVGAAAAARLGLPPPAAGTFLFFDVAEHLGAGGLPELLGRCADRGLLLAPGTSFGHYPTHVRLCFTAVPPERALRGVEVLAAILGR